LSEGDWVRERTPLWVVGVDVGALHDIKVTLGDGLICISIQAK